MALPGRRCPAPRRSICRTPNTTGIVPPVVPKGMRCQRSGIAMPISAKHARETSKKKLRSGIFSWISNLNSPRSRFHNLGIEIDP